MAWMGSSYLLRPELPVGVLLFLFLLSVSEHM